MKQKLLLALFIGSLSAAQSPMSIFRPQKVSYYYPSTTGSIDWTLSHLHHFTYNNNGDVLTALYADANGIPSRKDSNIYDSNFELIERYVYNWDNTLNKLVPADKVINGFDALGRSTGSLVYHWNGQWNLESGSEHFYSYNPDSKEETEITKVYSSTSGQWSNSVKKVTLFNSQKEPISITLYSGDAQNSFQLFSRQTFTGWHDLEKKIYKGKTTEKYSNATWVVQTTSTVQPSNNLWVETENRFDHMPGVYRILYSSNYNYREVSKSNHNHGWMMLTHFTKDDTLERYTLNSYNGDHLLTIETNEKEVNAQGSLYRTTKHVKNIMGVTINFSETYHLISYHPGNYPLEDMTYATNNVLVQHKPVEKIVYDDYVDVRLSTSLESPAPLSKIGVYPNPSEGVFHIPYGSKVNSIEVYGNSGNKLRTVPITNGILDISDLSEGLYLLLLQSESGNTSVKVRINGQ